MDSLRWPPNEKGHICTPSVTTGNSWADVGKDEVSSSLAGGETGISPGKLGGKGGENPWFFVLERRATLFLLGRVAAPSPAGGKAKGK